MNMNRRTFLTASGAVPFFADAAPEKRHSANDQIQLATIGFGRRGHGDTMTALKLPGVEFVGACDLYTGSLARAKEIWGNQLYTTRDYREILARKEIDALIIAVPDLWHSRIAIAALEAGKDIYLEKPMIHGLDEGPALIEAQRRTGRVLQIGSQYPSYVLYKKAREILKSGAIGTWTLVEAWVHRNNAIGATQYSIPPGATAEDCDWERFQEPAAKKHPYSPERFFHWRYFFDYGTGQAGDLYVHLLSALNFVTDSQGPTRVSAMGGVRFWNDGREVPDVFLAMYDYPETSTHPAFNATFSLNYACGLRENTLGFRFSGSEGVLTVNTDIQLTQTPRDKAPGYTVEVFPEPIRKEFLAEYHRKYPDAPATGALLPPARETLFPAPVGNDPVLDHFHNFFTCVREKKRPLEDAVFGFRAAGPALLANESYFSHQVRAWDPQGMRVVQS
jgi:predicted dehydrogenase